jgi:hypothetical protein
MEKAWIVFVSAAVVRVTAATHAIGEGALGP